MFTFLVNADLIVFYSFFKTLVDQEVTVELKNDLAIKGILKSVDQFLNIKLDDITVMEENKYPHLVLLDTTRLIA
jgi:U6 snRNA-associated Sm-like protein LSm2